MEFEGTTPPLSPDTKVLSKNQDVALSGKIVGIALNRQAVIGFLYIMELDEQSRNKLQELGGLTYPCIAVPEVDLELA